MQLQISADYSKSEPWSLYHSQGHSYGRVRLTVTDTTTDSEVFQGYLHTVSLSSSLMDLQFTRPLIPLTTTYRRFHRSCPYLLFDKGTCKADPKEHEQEYTISSIDKADAPAVLNITPSLGKHPDGDYEPKAYVNGSVVWGGIGGKDVSFWIGEVSKDGSQIVTRAPLVGLSVNDVVKIRPTCDKTLNTCKNRFDNAENYGGMPGYIGEQIVGTEAQDRFGSLTVIADLPTDSVIAGLPSSIARINPIGDHIISLPNGETVKLTPYQFAKLRSDLIEAFILIRLAE